MTTLKDAADKKAKRQLDEDHFWMGPRLLDFISKGLEGRDDPNIDLRSLIIIVALMTSLVLATIAPSMAFHRATVATISFTVKAKDIKGQTGEMLVFTKGEVLKCDDSWACGQFASTDTFGEIEEGKTYKAVVCGWRLHVPTRYRTIVAIKEIE